MNQTKNSEDYSSLPIIVLFALFGKIFCDFKALGGLNYPLLTKIIYMIFIVACLIFAFHSGEVKYIIKQTKIEDYFKKFK